MFGAESDRIDGQNDSSAPAWDLAHVREDLDIPGILAGHISDLYAEAERERRDLSLERAIARAKESA